MKKIISLGIASAVCALTAISASAAAGSEWGKIEGETATGSEIKVTLTAKTDVKNINFQVEANGLEVVNVVGNGSTQLAFYTPGDKIFRAQPMTEDGVYAKAGDVICTFTVKVTAESGTALLNVADVKGGKYTAYLPEKALEVEVKGAVTSDPTSSGTTSDPASGTDSGNSGASGTDSGASGTDSGNASGGENKPNPDTGVALAVIPAVLAAAGVIVAKKRK